MTRVLDTILGYASDEPFADALHDLGHAGKVEYLSINPDEVARRRFRLVTDQGTDCAIALTRDQRLSDGAVLYCDREGAIVVRLDERQWLHLDAPDKAAALRLGYFCGNLHWKVQFEDGLLHVAMEGPRQSYIKRLEPLLADGKASVVVADA